MKNILTKPNKWNPEPRTTDFYADVKPGESITIMKEGEEPKTFSIGDYATYGSYNLIYYGEIVSIGKTTVTIQERYASNIRHRLDLYKFAYRNHDFDLQATIEYNHNEMMYI